MVSRRTLLATALAVASRPAFGQSYPDRPVRVVVPFAPGGNVDRIARLLAQHWSARLGQPFVVENRAGAGGTLGAGMVAASRPDGYTLLAGSDGALLLDPKRPDVVADPLRSFAPIGLMSSSTSALIVAAQSPLRNVGELVALARRRPVTVGHPGVGTAGQTGIFLLNRAAHIELVCVAYRGGSDALADMLSGNVDALFTELSTLLPIAQAGQGRILAVAASKPVPVAPEVSTFADSGFPDVIAGAFVGLVAPLGTPEAATANLATALAESIAAPGMIEDYTRLAIQPPDTQQVTPAGFRSFLRMRLAEAQRWQRPAH